MSSSSASVRSFDRNSTSPLMEKFPDFEDIDIVKEEIHDVWSQLDVPSTHILLSCCGLARYASGLTRLLWFLLPTFVQSTLQRESGKPEKLHPTAYLDGMRGLAAFAVFLCHLSYGTWDITHTYGTGEPGENDRFLQLPIVRLLYSGPPMVSIFFVISGYVLSYKPIRLMRSHQYEGLMTSTSSSLFRRALRLYLPCFVSTLMVAFLAQIGLFALTQDFADDMRGVREYHVRAAPNLLNQLFIWSKSMFNFVNVFDWTLFAGTTEFDAHLWTIPVEYRCSLVLFLTHILIARMSTRIRLATLGFLLYWGAHWDRWDMTLFWAGQFLAELHHIKSASSPNESGSHLQLGGHQSEDTSTSKRPARSCLTLIIFLVGLFLASFPDAAGNEAPGYMFLDSLIPGYWSQRHRFWPGVGAILIVWSAGNLSILRSIFNSSFVQYLGKISFPLYVMHGPVIKSFGYMTMAHMYDMVGLEERWQFETGFLLAALLTIATVIWAADVFWRVVDIPCVRFSKWLEGKMFE